MDETAELDNMLLFVIAKQNKNPYPLMPEW